MFNLQNISLIYDMEKAIPTYALSGINLEIGESTFYGILGPSGSGKSSLLYTMSGLMKPTVGKVLYKEQDLYAMEEKKCADIRLKEFGFILQKHLLIPYLNIVQNVLVPVDSNWKEYEPYAIELLTKLGLSEMLHKKPRELSVGQCQRVAIARALVNHPQVLFADEMTASLDYVAAKQVLDLFEEIRAQCTILFVTHDERMVENADEIIRLRDGKLVDQ